MGAYFKGPIQTRRETSTQAPVPGSFHGCIIIADLQRDFPGHCLSDTTDSSAVPPVTVARDPLSTPNPTLVCLRGGAGNSDSFTNTEHVNATADPLLPRPDAPRPPGGSSRGVGRGGPPAPGGVPAGGPVPPSSRGGGGLYILVIIAATAAATTSAATKHAAYTRASPPS